MARRSRRNRAMPGLLAISARMPPIWSNISPASGIAEICCELTALPGRQIDDDGAALFRLSGGGKGTLTASQILVGDANDLAISVYCDEAGLHWRQEEPNTLTVGRRDKPTEIWHAGANRAYLSPACSASSEHRAGIRKAIWRRLPISTAPLVKQFGARSGEQAG